MTDILSWIMEQMMKKYFYAVLLRKMLVAESHLFWRILIE